MPGIHLTRVHPKRARYVVLFSSSQEEPAAAKLQRFVRGSCARKKLMGILNDRYEKEYDPDTDSWFYVNKVIKLLSHYWQKIDECSTWLFHTLAKSNACYFLESRRGVQMPTTSKQRERPTVHTV